MTFLQDQTTHLMFIPLPLIIFAASRNNHTIMFFLSEIKISELKSVTYKYLSELNIRKVYNVHCLYSTSCILLADCSSIVMQGENMTCLQVAMQYNVKENKTLLAAARRKVFLIQIRRDKNLQTWVLLTATFSRFQQLMTDTDASTLLIYIFRLTFPKLCKSIIIY